MLWQSKLQSLSLGISSTIQNNSEQSFGKYLGSVAFLYDVFIIALIVLAGLWGWHCGKEGREQYDRSVGF